MKIQDQLNKNKPIAVPDVRLLARPLAVAKIQEAGLIPRVIKAPERHRAVGPGLRSRTPAGGSKVGKGSTVTLTVSSGIPQVQRTECRRPGRQPGGAALAQVGLEPNIVRDLLHRADRHRDRAAARLRAIRPEGRRPYASTSRAARSPSRCPTSPASRSRTRDRRSRARGSPSSASRHPVRPGAGRRRRRPIRPPARSVDKGSRVTLSVSKGPATTQIPDVLRPEPGRRDARCSRGAG